MTRRLLVVLALVLAGLLGPVSYAAANPPGISGPGLAGFPGWFVALFVIVLVAGIGARVWRVSMARKMARGANMDTGQATAMTLLEDDGLEATYLAANLRGDQGPHTDTSPRSTASRLRELQQLHDQGLVTDEEYDARRRTILDSL